MKRVGILTFQRVMNYGGALQSLALQEAIGRCGCDVHVVDYTCSALRGDEKPPALMEQKKPGQILKWFMQHRFLSSKYQAFAAYRDKHLDLTKTVDRDSIADALSDFDAIVVGSDQVWNPKLTGGDTAYLLDFPAASTTRKIAYAASIGLNVFPSELEQPWAEMIGRFDSISVREKTAADYLASLGLNNVKQACDPTFLVGQDYWSRIAEPVNVDGPYMFVYLFVPVRGLLLDKLKELASSKGLRLVVLHSSARLVPGVQNVRGCSPEQFLGYVVGADAVFTSSFHGTCFSLIFNKDFYSYCPEAQASTRSRITDLLDELGLESRACTDAPASLEGVDWDATNVKIEAIVNCSTEMLRGALS